MKSYILLSIWLNQILALKCYYQDSTSNPKLIQTCLDNHVCMVHQKYLVGGRIDQIFSCYPKNDEFSMQAKTKYCTPDDYVGKCDEYDFCHVDLANDLKFWEISPVLANSVQFLKSASNGNISNGSKGG